MGGKRAVKSGWRGKTTPETERIVELLKPHYRRHLRNYPPAAYRYNSASIRVRVVDEAFRGKSRPERERMVLPVLEQLPEETLSEVMILLLLAPEELDDDLMNLEFENPSPSRL
jgi:stress-induced morphogen